jgi:hypothetical protein
MSPTTFSGDNIILNDFLTLNDSLVNSPGLGIFSRNGDDVTIMTSNGLKNMKDIGSGGGLNTDLSNMTAPTAPPVDLALNNHQLLEVTQIGGSTNLPFKINSLGFYDFIIGINSALLIEEAAANVFRLNMLDHSVHNAKDINFDVNAAFAGSGAVPTIGYDSGTSRFLINLPVSGTLFVTNNNAIVATQMDNASITTNILNVNDVLQLGVDVSTPSVVGEFRSNGTDVQVFSGGAVRNLSLIGTGGGGNAIVDADSNLTVIDGIGFTWVLDGITIATMTTEFILGLNLDMSNNNIDMSGGSIIDAQVFALDNGSQFVDNGIGGTDIMVLNNTDLRILEGTSLRLVIDDDIEFKSKNDIIFDIASNDQLRFTVGGTAQVGEYDDSTGNWKFDGTGDIQLSPNTDIDLTPFNDIIMNPTGDIRVFADLDMDGVNTIDFGTSASVASGNALGSIQVKVNGTIRLVKFYST